MTTGQTPDRTRRRRTFSAFGDVRRMPSEYEIVTHAQNWTTRSARSSAFEQNPSSAPNLWFLTYRDGSPLQADDWDAFRDPDALTYRAYVTRQADAETRTQGLLAQYGAAGADARLSADQLRLLGGALTPSRFLVHGCQQVQAYIGYVAPSSYVTNVCSFATADFLRRVTVTAYRTRELQMAHPESGIGEDERRRWETDPAWQGVREAVERLLVAYDWGEAFTALDLVLAPTLDDVLIRQTAEASRDNGDEYSWLLLSALQEDNDRRNRWAAELARFCIAQRPGNAEVLRGWIDRWTPLADAAVSGLGAILAASSGGRTGADTVTEAAAATRAGFHDSFLSDATAGGVR
ncbi:toluene hydroxylase [Pseudonocardia sp. NPDC049635]|uniref:toluene hydroxylase n=1 Tax=Pseudonocardia sp. NPDC049635 TaxID=3155506 RepID=UPI0033FBAD47